MSQSLLETVTINPAGPAQACVIWLHGLGADGHDFVDIVPQLQLPENLGVRFIFPHAPVRPVTLNSGMRMRAWFDIYGLSPTSKQDEAGMRLAGKAVGELIAQEVDQGIPTKKIILAGFSQGGAIALSYGLRYTHPLAGILGLSTWLPLADKLVEEAAPQNQRTPIMLVHGVYDPMVPVAAGQQAKDLLMRLGYPINWQMYPMQHQVCVEEIRDIGAWLKQVLSASH